MQARILRRLRLGFIIFETHQYGNSDHDKEERAADFEVGRIQHAAQNISSEYGDSRSGYECEAGTEKNCEATRGASRKRECGQLSLVTKLSEENSDKGRRNRGKKSHIFSIVHARVRGRLQSGKRQSRLDLRGDSRVSSDRIR